EDDVRVTAAQVLPKVADKHSELAVLALARAVSDPTKNVRLQAVTTLGGMGPKAKNGGAALGRALGDKDEAVVKAGQEAIAKLGPDAELAVPEMVQVMKKAEGPMLIELLKLLAKVGPNGKTAIADVAALGLKDPTDKELFEETVLTLGKIGPGDLKALYAVSR